MQALRETPPTTNCIFQVKDGISETAEEALVFLRAREEFWNQLKLGGSGVGGNNTKAIKPSRSKTRL